MKHPILSICVGVLFLQSAALADDLETLAGKWSVKKTNDQGQNITQTLEVKKNKFVFEILSSDDSVVLHAEGDLKLEKAGPFNAARFFNIRAGSSLEEVDDVYVSIYALDGDSWTMASNFDKQRDGQKPGVDVYHHVKAEAASKAK